MPEPLTVSTGTDRPYLAQARERGFRQVVETISKTFAAIPLIWVVVYALARGKVPREPLLVWITLFFVAWLGSLLALRKFDRDGPNVADHRLPVFGIVALEGVLWGAMLYVLMGHLEEMDYWALVLLVGIVSIVLPSYIAYPKAFFLLLFSTWASAAVAVFLAVEQETVRWKIVLVLLCYFLGLCYTIRPICGRVLEALRLQLLNEHLTAQLEHNLAVASHKANTDALTGQLNRHALNRVLDDLVLHGERRPTQLALLMLDVDFFKSINDQYGHDVGDLALQHVARCIVGQLREGDFCARYGGEEFVMLLPATNTAEAHKVAERIRAAIEAAPLAAPRHAITASIGLAIHRPGMTAQALLKAADSAVYLAKRRGRNQVGTLPELACA